MQSIAHLNDTNLLSALVSAARRAVHSQGTWIVGCNESGTQYRTFPCADSCKLGGYTPVAAVGPEHAPTFFNA